MGLLQSSCPTEGCAVSPFPTSLVRRKEEKSIIIDFHRVLHHALRSWAVYHTRFEIESGEFTPMLNVFGPHSVSRECLHLGSFGMFLEFQRQGLQWISIRGTQNYANIKDNLQYDLEYAPELNIRAHKGFISLFRIAWDELRLLLDKAKPVRVTGHSLGGAVASLVALKLKKEGYILEEVVTFGAPKFTDFDGCVQFLRLQVPLLRINNKGDPVAVLPPWKQYVHAGAEVCIYGSGPGQYDWMTGSQASVMPQDGSAQFWARLGTLPNHKLIDYLRNIAPKVPQRDPYLEALLRGS